MPLTKETAAFLLDLVNRQNLSVGAPDFDQVVGVIQQARGELLELLTE